MTWLPLLVSALGTAMIIAIMGMGVVIVYRTTRVLAFHVGETGVLAAYTVTALWQPAGASDLELALALGIALAVAALVGLVTWFVVDVLGSRFGHFTGTVITIAIAIILDGLMSLLWQGQARRVPIFSGSVEIAASTVPVSSIALVVIGLVVTLGTILLVGRTGLGLEMQAVANNSALARMRGVPVRWIVCVVWVGASALAGISGVLLASVSVVSIEGAVIGVSAIVAAILGGLTSLRGCVAGALLLAGTQTIVTVFFEPRYAQVVPVLLLLVLLVVRPSGITGRTEQIARV